MYALVSQEVVSGNGIRLPIIYDLKDNYFFINGTIPFFLEPPLFPIFLALFGGVTAQSFLAAQILNVTSHVIIAVFTFLLMKHIYNNNGIALLTGALVAISFPLLKITNYILSDAVCIAVTVATVYFLFLSRDSDQHRFNRNLLIASIFTSTAVLTRSAGVSLMPVFFWQVFILVKNNKLKLTFASNVLTILLPVIASGVLYTRAYILSGSIHGWMPPSIERSYFDAFTGTIKMILLQFNLSEQQSKLVIIVMILFVLYIMLSAAVRRELAKYVHPGLDLIVVFMITHTAVVTYAMAKSQTVFELRFMSPLVPFLFMLCALIIVVIWEIIKRKGFSKLSLCWITLSFGIIIFGNCYKTYVKSVEIFSTDIGHYRILHSQTYNWIKDNYGENLIITSNRPFHLSFFGGYSTIRLPHKRFEQNTPIPDNMGAYLPGRMSKFGSHVLALFEEADETHEGSYIAGLFHKREDDDNFILVKQFSDGVVYKRKE
jgi:hypothetical protein